MRFVVAVPIGWTLLLVLCAAGLGALVVAVPPLRVAIKALGIGYLLWLAFKLSNSSTLGRADDSQLQVGFGQGVMLQFLNIKAWLLAIALVSGWIAGHPDALKRFVIVAPVMLVYAFTSNFVYALAGALLRNWLAHGKRLLWFNRAMAAVLVLTAFWMFET
jgi:threonine/homoserine/homoserine lactone efflux protein